MKLCRNLIIFFLFICAFSFSSFAQDEHQLDQAVCSIVTTSKILNAGTKEFLLTKSLDEALLAIYEATKENPIVPATIFGTAKVLYAQSMLKKAIQIDGIIKPFLMKNPLPNPEKVLAQYLYNTELFPNKNPFEFFTYRLTSSGLDKEESLILDFLKTVPNLKEKTEAFEKTVLHYRKTIYESPGKSQFFGIELQNASQELAKAIQLPTNQKNIQSQIIKLHGEIKFKLIKAKSAEHREQIAKKYEKLSKYYKGSSKFIKISTATAIGTLILYEVFFKDWTQEIVTLTEKNPENMDLSQFRHYIRDNSKNLITPILPYVKDLGCENPES